MEPRGEFKEGCDQTQGPGKTAGGLSRRDFLKMAAITGGAIGVGGALGALLAACGEEEATTTSVAATTTTAAPSTTTALRRPRLPRSAAASRRDRPGQDRLRRPHYRSARVVLVGREVGAEHFEDAVGDGIVFGDGKKHPIQVLTTDTQSDSNRAAQVTADLILNNKVDLVFASCTPPTGQPVR